jgi:hypothetical protein
MIVLIFQCNRDARIPLQGDERILGGLRAKYLSATSGGFVTGREP